MAGRRQSPVFGSRPSSSSGSPWSTWPHRGSVSITRALAVLYTVPPLVLVYAYCLSHPRRATAILAVAATVVAVFLIGFAVVIPKGSAA